MPDLAERSQNLDYLDFEALSSLAAGGVPFEGFVLGCFAVCQVHAFNGIRT